MQPKLLPMLNIIILLVWDPYFGLERLCVQKVLDFWSYWGEVGSKIKNKVFFRYIRGRGLYGEKVVWRFMRPFCNELNNLILHIFISDLLYLQVTRICYVNECQFIVTLGLEFNEQSSVMWYCCIYYVKQWSNIAN